METLQIKKENAKRAYDAGCSDVKAVLENLLGAEHFRPQKITDRVKTFKDACNVLGIKPTEVVLDSDAPDEAAYKKLKVIVRSLNEGWKPDWKNASEYKYYPWFDMSSGSGLRYGGYGGQRSSSTVGSRLCFKSRELAEYAGNQFIEIYTEFFII